MPACAPILVRRLAAALALLAVIVLGLHEGMNPAGAVARGWTPPMAGGIQALAALDHDAADRGPLKHLGAVERPYEICRVVMRAPVEAAVAPSSASRFGAPDCAPALSGLDPGGLRRPPRASSLIV